MSLHDTAERFRQWDIIIRTHPRVAAAMWETQEVPIDLKINGKSVGSYKISQVVYHANDDADVHLFQTGA